VTPSQPHVLDKSALYQRRLTFFEWLRAVSPQAKQPAATQKNPCSAPEVLSSHAENQET